MTDIESVSYRHTDLACEADIDKENAPGVSFYEYERNGVPVSIMTVEHGCGESAAGRPAGTYMTVTAERPWMWEDDRREGLVSLLSELISDAIFSAAGKRPCADFSVLVCGLGNRALTADAIGPLAADDVTVTAQLKAEHPDLYERIGCCRVAACAPGVTAATGIEAADVISGITDNIAPDVIILIDALAARSCSRLASTIQISDSGIAPGSGIGNRRRALSRSTVGVPVVTVGVPTVVDSSTLVWDALEKASIDSASLPDSLREVLETGRSFFVAPKESDVVTREMARLIADAIDEMCGTA